MFPKRSLENMFLLCFLFFFFSSSSFFLFFGTFLSGNVVRNYSMDQYETFQNDSLAFVHAHALASEFLHIKTYKTNFFILYSN
jgi:hypothetical protein